MKVCRIIAGGEAGDCVKANEGELVICADRGFDTALKKGIKPDIVVGDFDSYMGELPDGIEVIRSVPEKDDTDTLLAIKTAIDRGAERIYIYGALGGRFDHTVANVQSLIYIHDHGAEGFIEDDSNIMTVCGAGEHRFPYMDDHYFSVFALSDVMHIESMTGVKYPLFDYPMKGSFPIGVSNEITGEAALLKIKSGTALIVRSRITTGELS